MVQVFDILRYNRNFRFLWISYFLYQINWWMQLLVMSWLAYELTNSVLLVSLFAAVRLVPLLLGPFIGAIADRMSRRNLLIAVQGLQISLASLTAILITTGRLEFWSLLIIGFVGGVVWSANYTTSFTMIMDVVEKSKVTNAIAMNSMAVSITRVIGPAIGGILIPLFGPEYCFWIITALGCLTIGSLSMIQLPTELAVVNERSAFRDLIEVSKYIARHRDMLCVILITFVQNLLTFPAFQSFMPVFAKDNLGLGPSGLGFLQAALGAGLLVGSLSIASLGDFNWKGLMYLLGAIVYAILFSGFAFSRSFPLALVLCSLAGLAISGFVIMQTTLMLKLAPEDMRGRCIGFLTLAQGAQPIGCLIIGATGNVVGASLATAINCAMAVILLIAIPVVFPNARRLG